MKVPYDLQKTLKTGGVERIGLSANIFVGMVESPLFIKPYLNSITRSELFTIMTRGMATIATCMTGAVVGLFL